MRTLYLAMSEMEHDKRSWRCPGMVACSVGLALGLHLSLREQAVLLREATGDSNEIGHLVFTAVATLTQIVAACCLLVAKTPRGDTPSKEALVIVAVGHSGAMFLQAYLASLGNLSASLAMGLVEPVLALVALWVVTSVPARPQAWVGAIAASLGLCFLTLSPKGVMQSDRTSLIQGLSSFALVLKNLVIRHLIYNEKVTVTARDSTTVTGFIVFCGCIIAGVYSLASPIWIGPTFCALTSSLLSTALLYVTTKILRSYNIVFASLFHVAGLFVEAEVMMPSGKRPDWVVSLAAVILLLVGLLLFLRDWIDSQTTSSNMLTFPKKPVNTHEQYTRVEFLLFSSWVIGVIFYVFQPRLSQRDLRTLSYVGLDKVIRRLLSVD